MENQKLKPQAESESIEVKKNELRLAYFLANKDEGQHEARKDWEITIGDGLNK